MHRNFILATVILVVASMISALSHWIAHEEQIFDYTILGFMSAVFGGMAYGLLVPVKNKQLIKQQ